jgi:hypothetical protein
MVIDRMSGSSSLGFVTYSLKVNLIVHIVEFI